jgi:hypothetical protein
VIGVLASEGPSGQWLARERETWRRVKGARVREETRELVRKQRMKLEVLRVKMPMKRMKRKMMRMKKADDDCLYTHV